MDLKPGPQLRIEATPEELLNADAYLLLNKELYKDKKLKNVIAQSIWGRLKEKMPDRTNGYNLLAISVIWLEEKNVNDSYYAQNRWFPEDIVKIGKPNIMRSHRFAQITIAAAQYNPAFRHRRNSVQQRLWKNRPRA